MTDDEFRVIWSSLQSVMSSSSDQHAALVRPQESKDVLQRYRFSHAAPPHDDARLARSTKKLTSSSTSVLVKRLC